MNNGRFKNNGPQPIFPRMPSETEIKREIRHEFGSRPPIYKQEEKSVETEATSASKFSREQLADGIKMSVILSPPVSKQRGFAQITKRR